MPLRQAIASIPKRTNKAQSTLEYAVIIVCVAAALIAMQIYMKRAVSGRLRQTSDDIGQQYDPKNTVGEMTKVVNRDVTSKVETKTYEVTDEHGVKQVKNRIERTDTTNNEITQEYGEETVGEFGELFPSSGGTVTPPTDSPGGIVTPPPDGGGLGDGSDTGGGKPGDGYAAPD